MERCGRQVQSEFSQSSNLLFFVRNEKHSFSKMDYLDRVCVSAPEHSSTFCFLWFRQHSSRRFIQKKLQHISAPVDHLTAQGEDIFKINLTKIRPVVLWGFVKRAFLPFVFPYCRESLRNQKSKNQIRMAGEIKLSPGALIH